MDIKIHQFSPSDETAWDKFVHLSSNGTLFHLRSFLSYHIDRKFDDNSLIFEKRGNIIAVFPAAKITEDKKNILYSHPGASFGGFVYNHLSYEEADMIIKIIKDYCIKNSFHRIFFIPTPILYSNKINNILEYLLHWHKYHVQEYYISSMIDIRIGKSSLEYLHKRKKRYIQKYLDNDELIIKYDNNFQAFYSILLENKKKHNVSPTHSLEELINLDKKLPGRLYLLLLYYRDEIIGGTLNIIANNKCGLVFYNMINYEFKDLQPATIQIFESINWAKKQNLQFLDLGVSQQPKAKNPLTPHTSLINFKEQFGAVAIIRKAFQNIFI